MSRDTTGLEALALESAPADQSGVMRPKRTCGLLTELIDNADLWIDIYANSKEDGDCLIWGGMVDSHGSPIIRRFGDRKILALRREVALAVGIVLRKGILATSECRNKRCVSPEHVIGVTRRKLTKIAVDATAYHLNPVRNQRIALKMREKNGRLTDPAVRAEIMESDQPQRVLAAQHGVSQHTISELKSGNTYRDYANPFLRGLGTR